MKLPDKWQSNAGSVSQRNHLKARRKQPNASATEHVREISIRHHIIPSCVFSMFCASFQLNDCILPSKVYYVNSQFIFFKNNPSFVISTVLEQAFIAPVKKSANKKTRYIILIDSLSASCADDPMQIHKKSRDTISFFMPFAYNGFTVAGCAAGQIAAVRPVFRRIKWTGRLLLPMYGIMQAARG